MPNNKDNNALFLKVMAHDLLAPLTAIKWQTELLQKHAKEKKKREQYLKGIEESTELGIALARHAHVASKILSGSYEGLIEKKSLSKNIEQAVSSLRLQYERHGLVLEQNIETKDENEEIDVALLQLFVWSISKFFLSVTPPNTTVLTNGTFGDGSEYILKMQAQNVPEQPSLVHLFDGGDVNGEFDQKFVFIKLIQEIAPKLQATVRVTSEDGKLTVTTTFP